MSRRPARTLRVVSLSMLAIAGPLAGTAIAGSIGYTTSGSHVFTVPAGVTSVQLRAAGGLGGYFGGFGASISSSLAVAPGTTLGIEVASNGALGTAGAGGGGAVPLGAFAGGGGGATRVLLAGQPIVVAAGGGGGGGDSFPGLGGLGGDAGAAGEAGETIAGVAGGGGGGAGRAAAPGQPGIAGVAPPGACVGGAAGVSNAGAGQGGTGGMSADPFGFGYGGGGGGGVFGGGGGGSGGYCAADDEGLGGGGGGGGSSLVPAGGSVTLDGTGTPSVTITWTDPPAPPSPVVNPSIAIQAPTEGAVYAAGSVVAAAYTCTGGSALLTGIRTCVGTVPAGARILTSLGSHTFTVSAVLRNGRIIEQSVNYRVTDQQPPEIARLRIAPRTISAEGRPATALVTFRLSERARVEVRIKRAGASARGRRRPRTVSGRSGSNRFRLRARTGRRTLRPGTYVLMLVAVDPAGNRSRAATRRFTVVD